MAMRLAWYEDAQQKLQTHANVAHRLVTVKSTCGKMKKTSSRASTLMAS